MEKGEGLVTAEFLNHPGFVPAGEKFIAVTLELVVLRDRVCICISVSLSMFF